MKYRIKAGIHVQTDADGVERLYRAGDIVEGADLHDLNGHGMDPKFEPVLEIAAAPQADVFSQLPREKLVACCYALELTPTEEATDDELREMLRSA